MLMQEDRTPAPAYICELGGMLIWFGCDLPTDCSPFEAKRNVSTLSWLYKFLAASVIVR